MSLRSGPVNFRWLAGAPRGLSVCDRLTAYRRWQDNFADAVPWLKLVRFGRPFEAARLDFSCDDPRERPCAVDALSLYAYAYSDTHTAQPA